MTASLHKLTAGDGYTYLTRQVAVTDSTQRGRSTLADYYTEKGERPGRWVGHGIAGLGTLAVGDQVTEAQMRALFGEGRHPDADVLQKAAITAGDTVKDALRATQLGRAYPVTAGKPTPFLIEVQRRYQAYNAELGMRLNHPVPEEVRATIRTQVGRKTFEEQHDRPPADEQELTSWVTRQSRRPAQAVAGFDVTFTPVKSVSTLWAVAPRQVAEQIEAAHEAAVDHALGWLEAEVAHTRRGAQGVRQTEVTGIVATAFTHRDSRNGDPNLHTHVAVANKVQDRTDGAWLSLDGAALYRAMVTISEHYNSHLEAEVIERLGTEFEEVAGQADRRPVREIVGVPPVLLDAWSSRRVQIEAETDRLAREFAGRQGRAPTAREMIQLAQQANLATRQDKHEPRSLADQRIMWRAQAAVVLGSDDAVDAITTNACQTPEQTPAGEGLPDDRVLARVAELVTETVSRSRARWQPTHVMAEAYRQLRGLNLPGEVIDPAVEAVTERVVGAAVPLTRADVVDVPDQLRRSDGSSVYEPKHTRLYTTTEVLDAEARIVDYALRRDGKTVDDTMLGLALLEAEANGQPLNRGQEELVTALGRSGQRVQLAIAPAGSGKTTAMRTLARAWVDSGGTIVGLAPSAVAADELRAAVPDGTVETLAKLTFLLKLATSTTDTRIPRWVDQIDGDTLVLIDEAGMAGTTELAAVIDFVIARGGSVRLIGDDRQLAAVAAGGVLRDVQEAAGSATLTELMRFVDPSEAAATLAVRDGDTAAVGFYLDRGRLHDTGDPTEAIVDAWWADITVGRSALMIAATREATAVLNEKARERRMGQGLVDVDGPSVLLRTGLPAAVGDRVLTRRNDRRNRLSATDFVKNGDRWTVVEVGREGRLQVSHQRSGKITWLDADYVRDHVDHAYAVTVHAAQGSTVDVSHVLIDGSEDRQTAYVALSRGRFGNHLYVRTAGDGDPHNRIRPEIVRPSTGAEILTAILEYDGTEQSASTTQRLAASPQDLLRQHALRYLDGVFAAAEDLAGPDQLRLIEEQAEELEPGITSCGGWPQLRMMLATIFISGKDPIARLREVRVERELGDARDVAAVLGWRLEDTILFGGAGPLPWLRAIPEPVKEHPTWGPYLTARAELVAYYATEVADQATLTVETPRWAQTISHNQQLWRDLAVWRAANAIADTDPVPSGAVLPASRERNYQIRLEERVDRTAGPPSPLPPAVLDLLRTVEPAVLHDPFWQVLARRLSAADHHGQNLEQIVADALRQGPLPEERPAAALWFRLAGHLRLTSADVNADIRLRPDWTDHLLQLLPDRAARRTLTSPDWPQLVAAVADSMHRTGLTAVQLLDQAVAATNLADPTAGGIPAEAVPAVLAARVHELNTPPPADHDLPPDPEDLDASRPVDINDLDTRPDQPTTVDTDPAAVAALDHPEPEDLAAADLGAGESEPEEVAGTPATRLIELNTAAAAWWAEQYSESSAAAYIAGRLGDDLATDDRVTVGYAPAGWSGLTEHLRSHGATDAELVDAGLAKWSRRGTLIDVMRDRAVFGIRNRDGDLVGFTGRAAPGDTKAPKWLNTPTTAIFTKGDLLFGLTENRDRLDNGATPVRVEGVMDALAVTMASNGRAVGLAPLGTALTAAQADHLTHAAPGRLVLHATDDDPAGLKAAGRDYWLLTARGIDIRKLILTGGEHAFNDPADAYSEAPASLAATLGAVDIAPPLAIHVIADSVSRRREQLSGGNLYATVGTARELGIIIAAAPADQQAELTLAAAAMLADTAPENPEHYLELIKNAADDAGPSWGRHAPAAARSSTKIAQQTRARLAIVSATLADLHEPAPEDGSPVTEAGDDSETVTTDPATRRDQRRRGETNHGLQPDEPDRER